MKINKKNTLLAFLLSFLIISPAYAILKTELAMLGQKWANALMDGHVKLAQSFYSPDAHIYPLLADQLNGEEDKVAYFEKLAALKNLSIRFDEQHVQIFADTAINSGLMTFSYLDKDKVIQIEARYSLFYQKTNQDWLIVDEQESAFPEKKPSAEETDE